MHQQLFDMLLINVTEFFRDPRVWEELRAVRGDEVPAHRDHAPDFGLGTPTGASAGTARRRAPSIRSDPVR